MASSRVWLSLQPKQSHSCQSTTSEPALLGWSPIGLNPLYWADFPLLWTHFTGLISHWSEPTLLGLSPTGLNPLYWADLPLVWTHFTGLISHWSEPTLLGWSPIGLNPLYWADFPLLWTHFTGLISHWSEPTLLGWSPIPLNTLYWVDPQVWPIPLSASRQQMAVLWIVACCRKTYKKTVNWTKVDKMFGLHCSVHTAVSCHKLSTDKCLFN